MGVEVQLLFVRKMNGSSIHRLAGNKIYLAIIGRITQYYSFSFGLDVDFLCYGNVDKAYEKTNKKKKKKVNYQ